MTNARTVSRQLGKQFQRSESGATRIRGWRNVTEGYVVWTGVGSIGVMWTTGTRVKTYYNPAEQIQAIAEYLIGLGYEVTMSETAHSLRINNKQTGETK